MESYVEAVGTAEADVKESILEHSEWLVENCSKQTETYVAYVLQRGYAVSAATTTALVPAGASSAASVAVSEFDQVRPLLIHGEVESEWDEGAQSGLCAREGEWRETSRPNQKPVLDLITAAQSPVKTKRTA
jgi:hypothetical protein